MTKNLVDVVVHIDETLPPKEIETLEDHIHKIGGVVSACNQGDQSHLISVRYDAARVKSHDILVKIQSEGLHAELVGF